MKKLIIAVIVLAIIAFMGAGFFIAKGPQPEVILPAEIITSFGPINISNTMISAWLGMIVIIGVALFATRSLSLIPSGAQNFVEGVVGFLMDQAEDIVGEEKARRLFPVVATIFIFLIVSNWMGLLPFFNAIGKTEDVGVEIYHELSSEHPHKISLADDGTIAEGRNFGSWEMSEGGGIVFVKPGAGANHYEVFTGETQAAAFDRYVTALAETYTDFHVPDEEHEHPSAATVQAAYAALQAEPDAPVLMTAPAHEEEGEEAHGIESPALGQTIYGVDFEGKERMALVIPFFRSVFSDVNNTLAMGFIAFFFIQFWGFQALGSGYITKFFNFNGINSFVGILELISEFIKIISFAFRLFGNIFAGEVLILMLTFLMPFLLVDIIYGLELFVGFIQAAVFALLTLVFGSMAMEGHGEDHDDHGAAGHGETHPAPHQQGAVQAH